MIACVACGLDLESHTWAHFKNSSALILHQKSTFRCADVPTLRLGKKIIGKSPKHAKDTRVVYSRLNQHHCLI